MPRLPIKLPDGSDFYEARSTQHLPRLRRELTAAQDGKCFYCGQVMYIPTLDHRIPRTKGGHNGRNNIVAACDTCNREKGNMDEADFVALIKSRTP